MEHPQDNERKQRIAVRYIWYRLQGIPGSNIDKIDSRRRQWANTLANSLRRHDGVDVTGTDILEMFDVIASKCFGPANIHPRFLYLSYLCMKAYVRITEIKIDRTTTGRRVGNIAQAIGITTEEAYWFVRTILTDVINEEFAPPKKSKDKVGRNTLKG